MSEQAVNEPAPAPNAAADVRNASIVYILYLATFLTAVTGLIGVAMAYVHRSTAPEWVQTHYRFQIRTFWIGLLYAVAGFLALWAVVGGVIWVFTAVWFVVRCVKGLKYIQQGAPVPNPTTWFW